jgi:hypothetical protein
VEAVINSKLFLDAPSHSNKAKGGGVYVSIYVSRRPREVFEIKDPTYYICVLILLYMCPRTAMYVSSYCYICVLILLYMCPHTAIYVSSYCYICVLILLYMCPHTTMYVSSYYMCVLVFTICSMVPERIVGERAVFFGKEYKSPVRVIS